MYMLYLPMFFKLALVPLGRYDWSKTSEMIRNDMDKIVLAQSSGYVHFSRGDDNLLFSDAHLKAHNSNIKAISIDKIMNSIKQAAVVARSYSKKAVSAVC